MPIFLIFGVVTEVGGTPLAGVSIAFSSAPVSLPDVALLSSAEGSFRMSVPAAGRYELAFHRDGFESTSVRLEVSDQTTSEMQVVMRARPA